MIVISFNYRRRGKEIIDKVNRIKNGRLLFNAVNAVCFFRQIYESGMTKGIRLWFVGEIYAESPIETEKSINGGK